MVGATEQIIGARRQGPGAGRSEATKQRNRRAIAVRAKQAAEFSEETVSCATGLRCGGGRHVSMASDHQTALRRSGPRCRGLASLLRPLNQIALASDALPKYSDLAWRSGCVRYLLSSNLPPPPTIFLAPVTCLTGSGLLCELRHTWTSFGNPATNSRAVRCGIATSTGRGAS